MSYIFNRINLIVVTVMVFLISMSMNEVLKFARSVDLSNKAAYAQWFRNQQSTFTTQEDCQKNTSFICNYEECTFVPVDQTFEELCDSEGVKGWRPTSVAIPEAYARATAITLAIGSAGSQHILTLDPVASTMTYTPPQIASSNKGSKSVSANDVTLLMNKMVVYEFLSLSPLLADAGESTPGTLVYTLTMTSEDSRTGSPSDYVATCTEDTCPRSVIDLKNDLLRLWGATIPGLN